MYLEFDVVRHLQARDPSSTNSQVTCKHKLIKFYEKMVTLSQVQR